MEALDHERDPLPDPPDLGGGLAPVELGAAESEAVETPVEAPVERTRVGATSMMRFQVTNAEYARCVADRACAPNSAFSDARRRPMPSCRPGCGPACR